MDYEKLYRENLEDFKFRLYEFKKVISAHLISEKKISQADFDELYINRTTFKRIYTLNLGRKNKVLEKIDEAKKEYFSSIGDKKYETMYKHIEEIETLLTDIFFNVDKYDEFHNDTNGRYVSDSFSHLVNTLNADPNFGFKIYSQAYLSFLDRLSDPYLRVINGIYEFLNKNDLINISLLEKKINEADEECKSFFSVHEKYSEPISPKILLYKRNNGKNSKDLSFPHFFKSLSRYLIRKLHTLDKNAFDDKIDIGDEKFEDPQKDYMNRVLGQ